MKRLIYFFVLLLFSVLIFGCGSDSEDSNTLYIKGVATAGAPLENSSVKIYDSSGTLIAESEHGTQPNGTFLISVSKDLVRDGYTIEVSGGTNTETGHEFPFVLSAVVDRSTMNKNGLVHVGPVSTLHAEYMDKMDTNDSSAAAKAVSELLSIPPTQNILSDLFFYDEDFSEVAFLSESEKNGGLGEYITSLSNLAMQQPEPLNFVSEPMPQAGIAGAFAMGLVQGAGSQIGDRATGWVLDNVFGESGTPNYPTDPAVINAIEQNSIEIRQLRGELEQFEKRMSEALQQILTQTQRNEYTILVSALLDDITRIESQHDTLWFITNHSNMSEDDDWENTVIDFKKNLNINDLEISIRKFQRVLAGSPDTNSALELWGRLHTTYAVTQQNHKPVFDQFQLYANLQLMALNLILEKRHCSNSGKSPSYFVDLYLGGVKKQSEIFHRKVLSVMAISMDHFMHNNANPYMNTDWHAYENNSIVLHATPSRESPVLAEADAITAAAMAIEQSFTVRLASRMRVGKAPFRIQNVPMILINIDTSKEYTPDEIFRDREPMPKTVHNEDTFDWSQSIWDFNRYVFTELPVGNYVLKDMNHQFNNLFHSDYLERQLHMQTDKHGNILLPAYPYPIQPI